MPNPEASTPAPIAVTAPVSVATKIPENSLMPVGVSKPTVSAAAALGLPENPKHTMDEYSKGLRTSLKLDAHLSTAPRTVIKPSKKKTDDKPKHEPAAATTPPAPDAKAGGDMGGTPDEHVDTPKAGSKPAAEPAAKTPPEAPKGETGKPVESPEVKKLQEQIEAMQSQIKQLTAPKPTAEPEKHIDPEAEKRAAAELKQKKEAWITGQLENLDVNITPEEHDAILEGGPEAVKKLIEMRKRDIATATLRARETIYEDLKPVLENIENQVRQFQPLYDDHQQLQRMRVEDSFKKAHPELAPRMTLCRQVAQSLVQQYPNEISQMSEPQVFAEVARQTKMVLEQMGITDTPAPTPAPAAEVVPAAPAPAAAPVAPKPTPKPPASMAPSGVPAASGLPSFSKSVAASLV